MPRYDFRCGSCDKFFERQLKIDDRQKPCSESCPNCGSTGKINIVIGTPSTVRDTPKMPDGFREVLSKIHSRNAGSVIKDNIR